MNWQPPNLFPVSGGTEQGLSDRMLDLKWTGCVLSCVLVPPLRPCMGSLSPLVYSPWFLPSGLCLGT